MGTMSKPRAEQTTHYYQIFHCQLKTLVSCSLLDIVLCTTYYLTGAPHY